MQPKGPTPSAELRRRLDLPVSPRSIMPLRAFMDRCFEEAELKPALRRQLSIAIDQGLTPLLLRTEHEERSGHLSLTVEINVTRVRFIIEDESSGKELFTESKRTPTVKESAKPQRELGLSLLKRVMDEVRLTFSRGFENRIEMIKFV